MEYRPDLMLGDKARTKEGKAYQERLMDAQLDDIMAFSGGDLERAAAFHFAGPNQKIWGPDTRQYQKDILRRYSGTKDSGGMPERDVQSAEGRRRLSDDQLALAQERFAALPEGGLGELETYYRGELDPKAQREERKQDMWATLTQIGAGMASSNSPFFLQAVGEAIGTALPGANASRKERREAERDARKGLREVLGLKREEQKEVIEYAQAREIAELRSEESQAEREARINEAAANRQFQSQEAELGHQRALSRIREQGQIANSQFEQVVAANRQRLLDQLDQGLPIRDPDGNVIPTKSGRLSNSAIEVLAQRLALKQINQYRASQGSATSPVTEATQPRGGAGGTGGGAEAPIMLDPM
jgi:hypothetical protein